MNIMEFNFVENHGLNVEGIVNSEGQSVITLTEGFVTVCKLIFDGAIEDFKYCSKIKSCYDQVEKCGMKYDREDKQLIHEKDAPKPQEHIDVKKQDDSQQLQSEVKDTPKQPFILEDPK